MYHVKLLFCLLRHTQCGIMSYPMGLAYPTRTKGLDPMMFRNYTSYVPRYVYHVLEQLVPPTYTPHSIGNQFPTMF
jgi:hypothetical protein